MQVIDADPAAPLPPSQRARITVFVVTLAAAAARLRRNPLS
jgi:hypothetical protein